MPHVTGWSFSTALLPMETGKWRETGNICLLNPFSSFRIVSSLPPLFFLTICIICLENNSKTKCCLTLFFKCSLRAPCVLIWLLCDALFITVVTANMVKDSREKGNKTKTPKRREDTRILRRPFRYAAYSGVSRRSKLAKRSSIYSYDFFFFFVVGVFFFFLFFYSNSSFSDTLFYMQSVCYIAYSSFLVALN